MSGNFVEFANRPESQGGMDIVPVVSMIGYQLEGQYVGTDNFSALIEGVFNVSGLEQGQFIPTITILNGFRFGKGLFGQSGNYISEDDWDSYTTRAFGDETSNPQYFTDGYFIAPDPSEFDESYDIKEKHLDKRGKVTLSTSFVFAVGRTFRAGNLNIPVNIFNSSKKDGGLTGVSVGFNVTRTKKNINSGSRY